MLTLFFEILPRKSESLQLWNARCNSPFVFPILNFLGSCSIQIIHNAIIAHNVPSAVSASGSMASTNSRSVIWKGWRRKRHGFQTITSILLFGALSFLYVLDRLSKSSRDSFQQCLAQKPPPNQNMLLLPSTFWTQLSQHPEKFTVKYQSKTKLLESDFIVMPMYERYPQWLIEVTMQQITVFL